MKHSVLIALCLMALCMPARAADEPLGRLFFTPQQRSALDAGRRIAAKPKAQTTPAPRRAGAVRLDGIVTRSDGERTVWINGRAHHSGHPPGVRVTNVEPTAARIQVSESGQTVKLKVGQTHGRSSAPGRPRAEAADRPGRTGADGSAARETAQERPVAESAAAADHDERD